MPASEFSFDLASLGLHFAGYLQQTILLAEIIDYESSLHSEPSQVVIDPKFFGS
ncbi:hypothetical protein D3C75_1111440 [compost metagenome]